MEKKKSSANLSPHHTKNYFGDEARLAFYERYRWLSNQSKITLTDLRRQPFDASYLVYSSSQDAFDTLGTDGAPAIDLSSTITSIPSSGDEYDDQGTRGIPLPAIKSRPTTTSTPLRSPMPGKPLNETSVAANSALLNSSFFLTDSLAFDSGISGGIGGASGNDATEGGVDSSDSSVSGNSRPSTLTPSPSKVTRMPKITNVISTSASAKSARKSSFSLVSQNSSLSLDLRLTQSDSKLNQRNKSSNSSLRSAYSRHRSSAKNSRLAAMSKGNSSSSLTGDSIAGETYDDNSYFNDFYGLSANAHDFASCDENDEQTISMISPRTKFLASCLKDQVNPRASLLLRKSITSKLNLTHQGITDQMAKSLSKSFQSLPFIEEINLADNMLTDRGITMIIHSVNEIPSLKELNFSQNKIGYFASKALREYLMKENCPLEKLFLHSSNIDDLECSSFITAIEKTHRLVELDLSNNEIGKTEKIQTKGGGAGGHLPSLIGASAIASLLRTPSCSLKKLNLSWNLIRLDGAINLGKSLGWNTSLLDLDLSYNTLNSEAAIAIGSSLIKNTILQTLNIAYASIDAMGCLSICAGIIENYSLKRLNLDGNPIGEQGGKALLLTPIYALNQVEISVSKCNVNIKDPNCWFDFDHLLGKDFNLNMENGLDRAVMIFLLHIVAGHHSLRFTKVQYEVFSGSNGAGSGSGFSPSLTSSKGSNGSTSARAPTPGTGKSRSVDLSTFLSSKPQYYFNDKQKNIIETLKRIQESVSNYKIAVKWFEETDLDGSGSIDFSEFVILMKKLLAVGEFPEKRYIQLFKKYDHDSSGSIDMTEFLLLLRSQKKEAISRIKDMLFCPLMGISSTVVTAALSSIDNAIDMEASSALSIVTSSTPAPLTSTSSFSSSAAHYTPPDTGFFYLSIGSDSATSTGATKHASVLSTSNGTNGQSHYRILTAYHCDLILQLLHTFNSSNVLSLLTTVIEMVRLRYNEAITIADIMLMETSDKIDIVQKILLQMYHSYDASHFLNTIFGENRQEVMRFKWDFNFLLKPLLGMLDFSCSFLFLCNFSLSLCLLLSLLCYVSFSSSVVSVTHRLS
jgi:hypothetical protein